MAERVPLMVSFAILLSVAGAFGVDYPVQPVPFTAVRITGGFWEAKQEINRTVTVPFALQQCEESHRLKNFDLAAGTMRAGPPGRRRFRTRLRRYTRSTIRTSTR